ncbi:MAG: aliphatic sulfonate ABC transporter substrate-binding protein [Paracoccus sp. (in: a-proteobacteria)]|uniref:aliphatic sulfonate ABC transporter substrate-binding protein n=1 Tax=Paracoccus sp. TaxID=267 RepID=UPI0026E089E4|nr:aliphatic sulfonate ABC transporter substrate-binding protein [Paracoccus sp. (in: a-proteobacteria)]MDO5632738.1 aliphatic sulfonate ABC transporter substrate-binding protein [Paracoccus sp. (in: a-proteobacteria)]
MTRLTRRAFGAIAAACVVAAAIPVLAQPVGTLKIGYQKTNLPVIARQQGLVEAALEPLNTRVQWVEFTAGPPLVEALNAGAVDVGWTGDAPPIFGQAAGANITYVAALPAAGLGEAVIARPGTGITTLADLRGKQVAVGKGTSAHNTLVAALESAGLDFDDIQPVYLAPADAGAAFASGNVDAWSIWDPFLAIAEVRHNPDVLVRADDVVDVQTWFLANGSYASGNAPVILATLGALEQAAEWADAHRDQVAQALHEVTGVPIEAQRLAADRAAFGIFQITPQMIAEQQATADRFHRLGLIPQQINVADAIWHRPEE